MVDGVSGPAESAAKSLEQLQESIKRDQKALSEMKQAMKALEMATEPNVEQIQRLEKAMGQLKTRVSASQSEFIKAGGRFGQTSGKSKQFKEALLQLADSNKKATEAAKETAAATETAGSKATSNAERLKNYKDELGKLGQAASAIPGPIGTVVSRMSTLLSAVSSGRLLLVGLVAAVVLFTTAIVKAGVALARYAVESANARRNQLLQLESVTRMRNVYAAAFALPRDNAADLQNTIDKVAASVSISQEKVAQYAMQLEKAGVRGKNMAPALRAVATAASGWGEEQANQTAHWAASLALTGGNVTKLAQRVDSQIGGVVQKKMLSMEVQAQKAQEANAALFHGVDINPLLKAEKAYNDLFTQSSASGQTFKRILGTISQALISIQTFGVTALKIFVQDFTYLLLVIESKWLDLRLAWKSADGDLGKALQKMIVLLHRWARELLVALASIAVDVAVWAVKMMFRVSRAIVNGLLEIGPQLLMLPVDIFLGFFHAAIDLWESLDFKRFGHAIVEGITTGITEGWAEFKGTLSGYADSLVSGFSKALDIGSPSKVFAKLGAEIPAGVAVGIKQGEVAAQESAGGMLANVPAGAGRGGGGGVQIDSLIVNVGSGTTASDAKQIAASIKRELENILEGVVVQMGAPAT